MSSQTAACTWSDTRALLVLLVAPRREWRAALHSLPDESMHAGGLLEALVGEARKDRCSCIVAHILRFMHSQQWLLQAVESMFTVTKLMFWRTRAISKSAGTSP